MSTIINHEHMVRSDCNATETDMTSAIIDHQCKKKASKFIFSPSEKTSEGIWALNTPITEALFSKDQNNYFSILMRSPRGITKWTSRQLGIPLRLVPAFSR